MVDVVPILEKIHERISPPFSNRVAAALWGLLLAGAILAFVVGEGLPEGRLSMIVTTSSALGLVMLLFVAAYSYASLTARGFKKTLRNVFACAGPVATVFGALYGLCWLNVPPDPDSHAQTHAVLERFGRFLFFAYPGGIGLAIAVHSIGVLRNPREDKAHSAAMLAIVFAAIQTILAGVFSAHISESGLATLQEDGKTIEKMGSANPITHIGLCVVSFLVIFTLLQGMASSPRFRKTWRRTIRTLAVMQPAMLIGFPIACYFSLDRQHPEFFAPGTGLGLLTVCVAVLISLVGLAAFAQPRRRGLRA